MSDKLTTYLADERFRSFASGLLGIDPQDIDFDRPIVHNSFDLIVWRDDVVACLAHDKGALMLTGSVRVSANSARRFLLTRAEGPAPENLAPGHGAIDVAPVRAAIPGAVDAYVSPAHDVLLAEIAEENKPVKVVVWDVLGRQKVAELPPLGRPVLDEWATGETAERWLRELGPHLRRPAQIPSSKEHP